VFEDSRGRIWIGTYEGGAGAGVGCFDGKRWTRFTRRDGLIDDRVYCMFIDSRKKMWFGTECGVSIVRYAGKPETLQEKLQKLLPQSGEIVRLGPRKKLGKL
jgi:ligand-binding sensor domain-containing protein